MTCSLQVVFAQAKLTTLMIKVVHKNSIQYLTSPCSSSLPFALIIIIILAQKHSTLKFNTLPFVFPSTSLSFHLHTVNALVKLEL